MAAAYIITHRLLEFGLPLHVGVRGVQAAEPSQITPIPLINARVFFFFPTQKLLKSSKIQQKRHLKRKNKTHFPQGYLRPSSFTILLKGLIISCRFL